MYIYNQYYIISIYIYIYKPGAKLHAMVLIIDQPLYMYIYSIYVSPDADVIYVKDCFSFFPDSSVGFGVGI